MSTLGTIHFVTGNPDKLAEVRVLYPSIESINIDLPEIQSLDPNMVIKAKLQAAEALGYSNVLVEDTSLAFDCLGNLPGTLIKWFLSALKPEGLADLVLKYQNHGGHARTVFGLSRKGQVTFGVGELTGKIVAPRGGGFGWDSIFVPNGHTKTFGEMSPSEKAAISMRTLAFKDLLNKAHIA